MTCTKQLLKTCFACATLCLTLPNPALGQYYETNYEEQSGRPAEESRNGDTEKKDEDGALPWWGWVIIIWLGLGWLADNNDESQSTESLPRQTTRTSSQHNRYVIDPSR